MKPLSVLYVTWYFSQACEGTYGRFHDVVHTLQRMDTPPVAPHVVPIRQYKGEPSPDVSFEPGNRLQRLVHYLRALRQMSQEVDLVHVVQADAPVSLFPLLLAPLDKPLVLGPNISLGMGRIVTGAIAPWTTLLSAKLIGVKRLTCP